MGSIEGRSVKPFRNPRRRPYGFCFDPDGAPPEGPLLHSDPARSATQSKSGFTISSSIRHPAPDQDLASPSRATSPETTTAAAPASGAATWSRGQGGLVGLPEEILQEILIRLPAKSVLRCRAVCRGWRRLTTDPAFLVAHHRQQPTLILSGNITNPYCLDAVPLQGVERRPGYWPNKHTALDYSCDVLLVVNGAICNPAMRHLESLPLMGRDSLVGLYRHQPSGEYRVLFWRPSDVPSELYCATEYCVCTVGSNRQRIIPCSITPVDNELISGRGPYIRDAPVTLHGNLYMHRQKFYPQYHRILVFDTVAESLRQMRPPPVNP
ncbi:hypothetical protein EJB05_36390, partial [Eragrostis curvula]